jgi:radical SAM protein with 4Fe4S-binding SPASM domain
MKSNSDWKHILSVDYIKTGKSSEEEEKEFMNWLTDIGIPKRIEVELHNWAKGSTSTYTQCHRLWSSVTVLFDGRVCLCCLDYEGEIELGNLNDQSLKDVLNSELYRTIRKNHIEGKFLEKCASCDMPMVKDLGEVATFSKIDLK